METPVWETHEHSKAELNSLITEKVQEALGVLRQRCLWKLRSQEAGTWTIVDESCTHEHLAWQFNGSDEKVHPVLAVHSAWYLEKLEVSQILVVVELEQLQLLWHFPGVESMITKLHPWPVHWLVCTEKSHGSGFAGQEHEDWQFLGSELTMVKLQAGSRLKQSISDPVKLQAAKGAVEQAHDDEHFVASKMLKRHVNPLMDRARQVALSAGKLQTGWDLQEYLQEHGSKNHSFNTSYSFLNIKKTYWVTQLLCKVSCYQKRIYQDTHRLKVPLVLKRAQALMLCKLNSYRLDLTWSRNKNWWVLSNDQVSL